MKKRLLAGLLVFVLIATTPVYASAATTPDVGSDEFADFSAYAGAEGMGAMPMRNYSGDEIVVDLDDLDPADSSVPSEDVPGEDESVPDSSEIAEEAAAPEVVEVDDTPATEGTYEDLPGMPAEYTLSGEQESLKGSLSTDGTLKAFVDMKAGVDFVPNQYIFFAEDEAEAELIASAYGGELLTFEYGVGLAEITEAYQENFNVEELVSISADKTNNMPAIAPNHILTLYEDEVSPAEDEAELYAIPNDPYLGFDNTYFQWHHETINSKSAWTVSTGSSAIKVMVIDSGVNNSHQDLTNVTMATGSATGDANGHGTHVAGIIAAKSNNGLGVGVAPDVDIYAYRADGAAENSIDSYKVQLALGQAMELGVHVINMSFGGMFPNTIYNTRMLEAMQAGIAMVVASGNDSTNVITYPSAYSKDIITVGNSTRANVKNQSSTTNAYVDLAAPGTAIFAPYHSNNTDYVAKTGTSMAAPVVTGVAALVLSTYSNSAMPGDLNNDGKRDIKDVRQLEKILKASTNKGVGSGLGTGIIDASKALNSAPLVPKLTLSVSDAASTLKTFESGEGTVTLTNANTYDTIYYTLNGKTPTAATGTVYSAPIVLTGVGKVTLKAIAVNGNGKASKVLTTTYTLKKTVTGLALANESAVGYGKTVQLKATFTPADATSKTLKWAMAPDTSNLAVPGAKITTAGKLTVPAYKDTLPTTIRVSARAENGAGMVEHFVITLPYAPTSVAIGGLNNLGVGKNTTLKATVLPANIPNKKVTWSLVDPDDSEFVSLTSAGKLTAKKLKETDSGIVEIKAASQVASGVAGTYQVKLFDGVVKTLTLPKTALIFSEAGTDTSPTTVNLPAATGYKLEGNKSTFCSVLEWTSSNSAVASVNASSGLVTGVAPGKATITAKATDGSGKTAKTTVTVIAPVTTVTVTAPAMGNVLTAKKSLQLKAVTDGTNQKVTWEIDETDKSLITLSKTGKVTAKAKATGIVTVQARSVSNNTIVGSIQITLTPAAATVTMIDKVTNMFTAAIAAAPTKPKNYRFTASTGVAGVGVEWKSSNPAVASIDANGNVTALKAGKATITATAKDYSGKKATQNVVVEVPVSDMTVYPKEPGIYSAQKLVMVGKSTTMLARPGSAYGKPTTSKVDWEIEVRPKNASENQADYDEMCAWVSSKVSISSKGVLSIKKPRANEDYWVGGFLYVRATATDGTGVSSTFNVYVVDTESGHRFENYIYDSDYTGTDGIYCLSYWYYGETAHDDFTVTFSNTSVAVPYGVKFAGTSGGYNHNIDVFFIPIKKGTTKITLKSNASGISKTFTLKVV